MICVDVRIIGLRRVSEKELYKICVESYNTVSDVIKIIESKLGYRFNLDEIMIVCNDKQVYVEETLPSSCENLVIFPLALGG
ncbi:MAG: hypothetical protein QW775_06325 [Ignisphaera sp.]|uniref:MoaD/ThiS family protein n=1 Tax=Ignisphaera aggregans TaxID=334771 RepID=A0A832CWT3_9CREN